MEFPFEFCALRFLLQWERSEKGFHRQMKGPPDIVQLRKALRYFQVARNFKGLKNDSKAISIVEALTSVDSREDYSTEDKVEQLAHCFKAEFNQFNLSAASKLLWLRHRKPYIIFDSRAVIALKNMDSSFDKKSYSEYCQAWRKQYLVHQPAIKAASAKLIEIRSFLPAWHVDEEAMLKLTKQPWFLERVFDIFLWEVGGEG